MRIGVFLLAVLVALAPAGVAARSHRSSTAAQTETETRHRSRGHHRRIHRDPGQRREFMRENPCPGGPDRGSTKRCRGYVVDHIKSLKRHGADRPWNMQWQTKAEAAAKDRSE